MSSLIKTGQISQQVPKVSTISELRTYTSHEGNYSELFFLATNDQFYKYDPSDTSTPDDGDNVIVNTVTGRRYKKWQDPELVNSISDRLPFSTISDLRLPSTDNFTSVYITDEGKYGVFQYDPSDTTSVDDGAMVIVSGSRRYKRVDYDYIKPEWFGAKGDGVTDDSTALQNTIDFTGSLPIGKRHIYFSGNYKFTNVDIKFQYPVITGTGILQGNITIGEATPIPAFDGRVEGLIFQGAQSGITLHHCRRVNIDNCIFREGEWGVRSHPDSTGFHVNAQINITNSKFFHNTNCVRLHGDRWETNSDWTFSGNITQLVKEEMFIAEDGLDGLKFINNVCFGERTDAELTTKRNHIRIGTQSDWVIIANNNFFAAGWEAIHMTHPKDLNITGNNFAWTGQSNPHPTFRFDGILATSERIISIKDNIINLFSGDIIKVDGPFNPYIDLTGNTIKYADTMAGYMSSTPLSSITHYIINSDDVIRFNERNTIIPRYKANLKQNIVAGKYTGSLYEKGFGQVEGNVDYNKAVTASTKINIARLHGSNFAQNYAGNITLKVRFSPHLLTDSNMAQYVLRVSRGLAGSVVGTQPEIVEIDRSGMLLGSSSNWPSFIFGIETVTNGGETYDVLTATPQGVTGNTFNFSFQYEGDLIITEEP